MVAEPKSKNQICERVAEIYHWLDSQISGSAGPAGVCEACGKCCDFESFEHRLFITAPELMYLAESPGVSGLKPMTTSRCPYNIDGKCTIYGYRFAGCRIFCCRGNKDFQNGLSESALKKFKSLCTDFQIPYRYAELAAALNNFAGA